MKVAYVADVMYPYTRGGSEKRVFEISRLLAKKGHEVHVFGIKWWNGESTFEKDDVVFHGISRAPSSLFANSRRSITEALYFSSHLPSYLLNQQFDVVHCLQSPVFHIYMSKLLSCINKYRVIVEWYEVWADYWYEYIGRLGLIGKLVEKNVMNLTRHDKIITISEYTKKRLVSLGSLEENITIIPNGVDYSEIQKVPVSQENLDVIFVGRFIKAKNVDVLVRAIPFLKKNFPDVTIGLVGDGPEKVQLKKLVKKLGAENNVRFYGSVDSFLDVISFIKGSKMFVYPAAPEGGGSLSMIEANASGIPTIAAKDGPLGTATEVIIDKFNGLLVEELTPKNVADKIGELLADEQMRDKMAKNAKRYSKQFDWPEIAKSVETFYMTLV
jgi:glycosyltransferase involved in cell wall biosynthesis